MGERHLRRAVHEFVEHAEGRIIGHRTRWTG
jgi:hypothetical protein